MEKTINLFRDFEINENDYCITAILGCPASGKTILLSKFLLETSKKNIDCLFISSEIYEETIRGMLLRELGKHKRFYNNNINNRGRILIKSYPYGQVQMNQLFDFIKKSKCKSIFIDSIEGFIPSDNIVLGDKPRTLLLEKGIEKIENLKGVSAVIKRRKLVENLRDLSNLLNCNIYFTAQMNRSLINGEPTFRNYSNYEYLLISDLVFSLKKKVRNNIETYGIAKIEKNRCGEDGREYKFNY